jgi:hypothetical protein
MQPAAVTLHPESTVCGGIVSYIEGNILSFHKIKPIHSLVDDAESIRIKSLRGAGCNIRILGCTIERSKMDLLETIPSCSRRSSW